MDHDSDPLPAERLDTAQRDLHLTRLELSSVRTDLEHVTEALQRVRRQRAKLREQSEALADGLAAELSASYWRQQESGLGRLRRRDPEAELVRELEVSALFDAGWYLRQNQREIVEQHLAPALHHVRHANAKRLDPSEGFSTRRYLARHPQATDSGLPALVHAERNSLVDDGLACVDFTES